MIATLRHTLRASAPRRVLQLLGLAASLLLVTDAAAQPALIPVVGTLLDTQGNAVTSAEQPVTFRIYAAQTGGAPLFEEQMYLSLHNGRFHHLLGSGALLPLSEVLDGNTRWLGIQVDGQPEMRPRLPLTTTPYAAWAARTERATWDNVIDVPPAIAAGGGFAGRAGIAIDEATRRVGLDGSACGIGAGYLWNGGAWTCTNPADSLQAGFGLVVNAGVLRINENEVQRRPDIADCPFGIRMLAADGSVTCATSSDTDLNAYNTSCPSGQVLRGYNANGTPACIADRNTNVFGRACTGAFEVVRGYTIDGQPICGLGNFVDTNVFGRLCPVGTLLTGYDTYGEPRCQTDANTNTNVFGQSCASPLVLRGFTAQGSPICVTDSNTSTAYSVTSYGSIRLSGNHFTLASLTVRTDSCVWQSCSNGNQCICPTGKIAAGWEDNSGSDHIRCCYARIQQ